ncbi:unnamed protein product [Brachionus calyciflorus]|uniref:Uncharacterized protein n=1 Tax=Brachionus calyciflorus TaxID=104777 RepID=A0A813RZX4_9BILA|nr:unnamed protein product [Brachionus calyciflorus]
MNKKSTQNITKKKKKRTNKTKKKKTLPEYIEPLELDEKESDAKLSVDDENQVETSQLDDEEIIEKFERPIIDFSIFDFSNNDSYSRPNYSESNFQHDYNSFDKSTFGIVLLKSFFLHDSSFDQNLRDLIDKLEEDLWIDPNRILKNKENNFSFTSLSDVTSRGSSKIQTSKKSSRISLRQSRKKSSKASRVNDDFKELRKQKSVLSIKTSKSKTNLTHIQNTNCCNSTKMDRRNNTITKHELTELKNLLEIQIKK